MFPRIFGHEAAGIIESIGDAVSEFEIGDHVLTLLLGECKQCKFCKSNKTNMCQKYLVDPNLTVMRSDQRSRFWSGGKPVHHFLGTSTFSEYTVMDQGQVVKVSSDAPLSKICLLSCGILTGVGAVLYEAKVEKGSTIAVFGLGALGLAVIIGAKMAGASKIIGIDINPAKFNKAKALGATDVLNPKELDKPVEQEIQLMTDGGVDYSFECVGNTEVMQSAYECCHIGGGKNIVIGMAGPNEKLTIDPRELLYGRTRIGTMLGGVKPKSQLPHLLDLYAKKELQFDEVISHELPFSEINQAFDLLIKGEALRCVLSMG